MDFIILTGMSGSGKSNAANTLEDMGYYCIDNMPVSLIPKFVELYTKTPGKSSNVAFIIDVRGEIEFDSLFDELAQLSSGGFNCRTIFIDCNNAVLLNRYKETRRIHPLVAARNISVNEALATEREMLSEVKSRADYIIDTSAMTIHQLRDKIVAMVTSDVKKNIFVTCMSFGFKYGITTEADLVFDVRCFPNPFYEPDLKDLTGIDKAVSDYVFSFDQTKQFMKKLCDMIDFLMPLYIEEGKAQLIIAIGCTGGKHRSVAIAEALAAHLKEQGIKTISIHRDIIKKAVGDK
ncbi:MAG: RNase adapter RapZ [Eubacteriales bacterium]